MWLGWHVGGRVAADPKCKLDVSSSPTLPEPLIASFVQGYFDHCVVTGNDRGNGKVGEWSFILGFW